VLDRLRPQDRANPWKAGSSAATIEFLLLSVDPSSRLSDPLPSLRGNYHSQRYSGDRVFLLHATPDIASS
jgi:hypothetical protein